MRNYNIVVSFCLLLLSSTAMSDTSLILPIVITSDVPDSDVTYYSVIDIVSVSGPSEITFTGFSNEGGPISVYCDFTGPLRKITHHGSTTILGTRSTYQICGQFDPVADNGWILVELSADSTAEISTKILHQTWNGTKTTLQNAMSVPAIAPARNLIAPITNDYEGDSWDVLTSYAIINPSETQTAVVRLDAGRRKPGKPDPPECQSTIDIPPRHRIAKFINELFPTCDNGSAMKIESNIPIGLAAVEVYFPSYEFVGLPVHTY